MSNRRDSWEDELFDPTKEMTGEEVSDWWTEEILKRETNELLSGEISYGDGDITEKARRILELGSRRILDGKPSPAFSHYVAICIQEHINKGISLDVAFSRKKRGRPKRDPQQDDHIVIAYHAAASAISSASQEECLKRGFDAAFLAMHGKSEDEYRHIGWHEKSIDNLKTATREFLKSRGLY